MKLSIITPMYRRHAVFKIWCAAIADAIAHAPPELECRVTVGGSEGSKSAKLVSGYDNFDYVETVNSPLGTKYCNIAQEAIKRHDPDYLVIFGSDNIICRRYLHAMYSRMERKIDYFGHVDGYKINLISKQAVYWGGYTCHRRGEAVGSGRFFSRKILKFTDGNLWDRRLSMSLDGSNNKILRPIRHTREIMNISRMRLFHTGMKSGMDKNKFVIQRSAKVLKLEELLAMYMPDSIGEMIMKFRR